MRTLLQETLQAACEVSTAENELLFTGRIAEVVENFDDKGNIALDVQPLGHSELPEVHVNTPIKIAIFNKTSVQLVISAVVYFAHGNRWRVVQIHKIVDRERRGFYRIAVDIPCIVRLSNGNDVPVYSAKIRSISLSGLLVELELPEGSDPEPYQLDDYLTLEHVRLHVSSPQFSFHCQVRRITQLPDKPVSYGCSFDKLTRRDQDRLLQSILALQRDMVRLRREQM